MDALETVNSCGLEASAEGNLHIEATRIVLDASLGVCLKNEQKWNLARSGRNTIPHGSGAFSSGNTALGVRERYKSAHVPLIPHLSENRTHRIPWKRFQLDCFKPGT